MDVQHKNYNATNSENLAKLLWDTKWIEDTEKKKVVGIIIELSKEGT
jgi:hypothetical protein